MTEHLSDQQIARLEALQGASRVLGRRSEGAFKASVPPDVVELVDLAEYIIRGIYPHDRYNEPLTVLGAMAQQQGKHRLEEEPQ